MRASLITALVLLAAFMSGCDSLYYHQYVIRGVSDADKRAVVSVMGTAARESGLKDRTNESRVQNTLAYYAEPVPHFGVDLGARVIGGDIVVDLVCFHPGSAPNAFHLAAESLTRELPKAFPGRFAVYSRPKIPLQSGDRINRDGM